MWHIAYFINATWIKKILDFPGKKIAMHEKFNSLRKCFNTFSWQPYRGKSSEKQDTVPGNQIETYLFSFPVERRDFEICFLLYCTCTVPFLSIQKFNFVIWQQVVITSVKIDPNKYCNGNYTCCYQQEGSCQKCCFLCVHGTGATVVVRPNFRRKRAQSEFKGTVA